MSKECSLCDPLSITMRTSRVFGVAPLRVTRLADGSWRAVLSPSTRYYGYLLLFLLQSFILLGLLVNNIFATNNEHQATATTISIWLVEILLTSLLIIIGVVEGSDRMKQTVDILNVIDKIQIAIRPNQKKERFRKLYKLIVIFLIFCGVDCFTEFAELCYIRYTQIEGKYIILIWIMNACYYTEQFITILLELQFFCLAMYINVTLEILNNSLNQIICNLDTQAQRLLKGTSESLVLVYQKPMNVLLEPVIMENTKKEASETSKAVNTVRDLTLAYGKICDAFRSIEDCYEKLVVLLIGLHFVDLLAQSYISILYSLNKTTYFSFHRIFLLLHCICRTVYLMILVEPGQQTLEQFDRTRMLVSQLLRRASSSRDALAIQLNHLIQQIVVNKDTSYFPMGLCTLTRSLVLMLFGGMTTYLVIILQFQTL